MYFMDDERLREYERFMQHTPHYRPRGCGVIGIRIMDTKPPPAPYEERMGQMAAHIPFQSFRMRLNQYLKESEGNPMIFKDGRHQAAFCGNSTQFHEILCCFPLHNRFHPVMLHLVYQFHVGMFIFVRQYP